MTFDNFVADPLDAYFPLIVIGAFVVEIGLIALFISGFYMKKFGLLASLTAVVGAIGVGFFAFDLQGISDDVKDQNRVIAENNLKEKYDIVSVLWAEENTYPESYDLADIAVQDKDNNILEFRYKIDPETKEPHLLNDSDDSHVKSNDLLKSKAS